MSGFALNVDLTIQDGERWPFGLGHIGGGLIEI